VRTPVFARFLSVWVASCLLAGTARAAEIDGCHPRCGAPGDRFYVQGTDFGSRPVVTLGDAPVDLLRVRTDALLCRVPEGAPEGEATLLVNGAPAPHPFRVTVAGGALVHTLSVTAGPPGQVVYAFGRRLDDGHVVFVDEQGREAATAALVGGRRVARFRVPPALSIGRHTLVFEGADGRPAQGCEPRFEVVVPGPPALCAILPRDDVPSRPVGGGDRICGIGTDLAPAGACRVHWTDARGVYAHEPGRSNGYDEIATTVPTGLGTDGPCTVRVELASGAMTPPVPWTGGVAGAPGPVTLDPPAGPPGTCVAVLCDGLSAPADEVRAVLSSSLGTVEADVLYRHPAGLGHGAAWLIRTPDSLATGPWQLVLHTGARTTRPVTWQVTELPFAVTGIWPRDLGTDPGLAYRIEGSGFGSAPGADDLWVLWTSGTRTLHGSILYRSDRSLRVLPPSDLEDSLRPKSWNVYVVRSRRAVTMTARARALGSVAQSLAARSP